MTTEQQELLNRIKREVAKENGFLSWKAGIQRLWPEVCLRYADEVNKKLLKKQEFWSVHWNKQEKNIKELKFELNLSTIEIERLKVSRQKSCEATYNQAIKEASAIVDQYRLIESPGTIAAKIRFLKPNIVIIEP